ncbi:DEAD/DEAH box helicase [Kineococcus terrestris]|uniref:DEAD/DEAH box helicase n=1 Tax=Kineococcus terrestris TaxID=2044856 RepID=UPI0034DB73CD
MVVQGLWTREGDPALGTESGRRRPGAARAQDLAELASRAPRARRLAAALARPADGAVHLSLPCTPAGTPLPSTARPRRDVALRPVRVPVVRLRGLPAVQLLHELAGTAVDGAGGGAGVLGHGLRWLAHVAAQTRAAVDAGRVVPGVVVGAAGRGAGARARWEVLPDRRQRRWRTSAAGAAPPQLRAELPVPRRAEDVLDEVSALVADLEVQARTAHLPPPGSPGAPGLPAAPAVRGWLEALAGDGAWEPPGHPAAFARAVREWQRSADAEGWEVVLRVAEPAEDPDDPFDPSDPRDPARDAAVVAAPPVWTLQARLRPLDDPSAVLTLERARAEHERGGGPGAGPGAAVSGEDDPLLVLLSGLARAGGAHPPLRHRFSRAADGDVDLDLAELLDLVETGAPALTAAGVPLLLPGRWSRPALTLSLSASAAQPGAVADPQLRQADLVAFEWRAALGGSDLTEAELRALAGARSPLVRHRGEWVHVDADALRRSAEFLRRRGAGTAAVTDLLAAVAASRALPAPVTDVRAAGVLGDLLSGAAEHRLEPVPAPAGLTARLRPYQERGLAWLAAMSRLGLGAVLADDMGLGKTLQLLALLAHEREAGTGGPTLLVCPMSVVGNWRAEAQRFVPDLRVHVQHGPGRPRGEAFARTAGAHDLVVTTYGSLLRDVDDVAALTWRRLALDEAQHVKNASTRSARAVRAVRAQHRVALTGTPVENRLEDLRAVLDAVNPGLLGSAASFKATFGVPVEKLRQEEPARRLAVVTRPFVLRRAKTDPAVAADLPEKLEMTVRANLTAEQAALYRAVVDDLLARLADVDDTGKRGLVLAALTKLKQVCNHPAHFLGDRSPLLHRGRHRSGKLELLDDVVDGALADGEKVLCFTQFARFGELLAPHLAQRTGGPVPFLHGGLGRRARDELVARFAEPDGPPVLLLSLRAGGTGLNLTAASQVVHVDRWWNPAVEDQATDRAHRIGQVRRVQVRKLVSAGTVEERVDALVARKRDLAGRVVGSGEGWIAGLDRDALAELVRLGEDAVGE